MHSTTSAILPTPSPTYIDLPHLLSQTNSSYVSFDLFSPFHLLLALFTFSIHCFHQNIFLRSSQNMAIPHHTFALFSLSAASFNCNMSISPTVFLLSTNFTVHISLNIDFLGLLKIATLFSLKHHISLPCNIADLT